MKIMFACYSNIVRSPMSEIMFKKILKDKNKDDKVFSKSLAPHQVGNDLVFPAAQVLVDRGYGEFFKKAPLLMCGAVFDFGHQAEQIVEQDYNDMDYVVVFDEETELLAKNKTQKENYNKIINLSKISGKEILSPGPTIDSFFNLIDDLELSLFKLYDHIYVN